MTEVDSGGGQQHRTEGPAPPDSQPLEARRRITRWPGWIWAVPLAALFFVIWLGVKSWLFAAPTVTVTFQSAEGVSLGTPVRHRGVEIGMVEEVRLSDELEHVTMTLSIRGPMGRHLREETKFWIKRPALGGGGVLNRLLGGAHIAIEPGEGPPRYQFEGLAVAPLVPPERPGVVFTLHTDAALGSMGGAPIRLAGNPIGEIIGTRYRPESRRLELHAFVEQRHRHLVRESSVFWQAGGVSVAAGPEGLQVDLPSIPALAGGGVALHTPRVLAGKPVESGAAFDLHPSRGEALAAPGGPRLAYVARLPGAVGGLQAGAPVRLEDRQVGYVAQVGFEMDAAAGRFTTPVTVVLDATRFGIEPAPETTREALRGQLDQRLRELARRGLRARASAPLLFGATGVQLAVLADVAAGELDTDADPPGLPVAAGVASPAQAMATLAEAARTLDELPLSRIAANLRQASSRLLRLIEAPELERSLASMATALDHLEAVAASADQQDEAVLSALTGAAGAVESAASAIGRLSGGAVRQNRDLPAMVEELTETARSVRRLADYLSRHPEALLQGREERR